MFWKKETDSEKEVELLYTIYDFLMEAVSDDMNATSYNEKEAKKSLAKKSQTLEALERYDVYEYKTQVEKGVYRTCSGMSVAICDFLRAFIAEDEEAISGPSNPYEVERLIAQAREAEARLKAFIPPFKVALRETVERYKQQHDGKEPDEGNYKKYSIRKQL